MWAVYLFGMATSNIQAKEHFTFDLRGLDGFRTWAV